MRLLGQLAAAVSPTTDEYANGLITLNAMLGSWNNERLMCYATRDETIALSNGDTSKTIGPTGDLVTTRPVQIIAAYIVQGGISYDIRILSDTEYAGLSFKGADASWPTAIYYEALMSNGVIFLYPVPSTSSDLHVVTRTPLTAFAAGDTVTLPPGWEDALATNLAVKFAPEFDMPMAPPAVTEMARESKANIKRANSQPIKAYTGLAGLVGDRRSNIIANTP